MRLHKFLLAAIAILSVAATAKADIVLFDLENDGAAATPFGIAVDTGPTFSGTQAGITFTATASSNVAGATNPNSAANGIGVNSSVAGDGNNSIDPGEVLTLTVTFNPADFSSVQLATIDLGNIGGAGDAAVVGLPGGTTLTFSDANTAPDGFTFSDLNDSDQRAPDIITVNRLTLIHI